MKLSYHEIVHIDDPLLMPWLDAIQKNFPPNEQMLASYFLNVLHKKKTDDSESVATKMIAVQDENGNFAGDLMYELLPNEKACYLWYIVVERSIRVRGVGTAMYQWMVEQAKKSIPDLQAIIFEVERPDQAANDEERMVSEKRIKFYKKQKAKVATNIVYRQSVGDWQPSQLMYLCIQAIQEIHDDDALSLFQTVFGETMDTTNDILLE